MNIAPPPGATEEEFQRLCDLLYRQTGLALTAAKRYYVDRRVADRMAATGAGSFASYFALLRADAGGEMELLVNSLTVNETYYFREDHQLRCLTSSLLGEVIRHKRRDEPIRIWSVPCSTGEEPYSIAIWLLENWPAVDDHEIEIVGSDIDTRALAAAREGTYGRRALSRLPPDLIAKYFHPAGEERWQIIEGLRDSILLNRVNLVDGAGMARHGRFDVIFCRNVLIYFDDASRRIAAGNLYDALRPGGYICLGHAESMSRISPLLEVVRTDEAIVYRRPGGLRMTEGTRRVLVVDDSALVRHWMRHVLEPAGFELEEALNGIEALEKALAGGFDLIIVDVNMPRMDGMTFLRALRRQPLPIGGTPALVASTESGPQDREAARQAGANFYLVKPLDEITLRAHVAALTGAPAWMS